MAGDLTSKCREFDRIFPKISIPGGLPALPIVPETIDRCIRRVDHAVINTKKIGKHDLHDLFILITRV